MHINFFSKATIVLMLLFVQVVHAEKLEFQWNFEGRTYRFSQAYDDQVRNDCFVKINQWQAVYGAISPHRNKYLSYLRNYPCGEFLSEIALSLKNIAQHNDFTRLKMANFLIAFVKSIPYILDQDHHGVSHYPQPPYETLFRGKGDCEDHAILLAYLYSLFCYDALMMRTANAQSAHLAVGLAVEDGIQDARGLRSFYHQEKKYLYCEATPCASAPCNSEVGECFGQMAELKIEIIFDLPLLCDLYYE